MDFLYAFQVDPDPNLPLDPQVSKAVTALWNDPAVATVLEHSSEFYMMDSAP